MLSIKSLKSVFFGTLFVFASGNINAVENQKLVDLPPAQMNWETTAEGVGFAPLQGDRFHEEYMAMVRLPAGHVSPAHVKTANMYGLVVSGIIANIALDAADGSETPLPAGSYYKIPSGLPHISKCLSKVECVTFLYQDGKFDFLPISQ